MTKPGGDRRRFSADKFFLALSPTKSQFQLRREEVIAIIENAVSEIATKPALTELPISEINLRGANLENVVLVDAVLDNINLTEASLLGAIFLRVNLKNAILSHANLAGAIFEQCSFENADLAFSNGSHCWLNGNFSNADFHLANLMDSFLSGDFRHASFEGANLENGWIQKPDLRGVNLNNASLAGCTIWGARVDTAIRMPDGNFLRPVVDDWGRFKNPKHPNFWKSPVQK